MDPLLLLFGQRPRDDWQWTLNPHDTTWNAGNALALANCALLAYSDPHNIDRHLRNRGFERVISCNADHSVSDTQAYVAVRADTVVIAFRGTEPTSWRDFATDFNAQQTPFEHTFPFTGWGHIHAGWAEGVLVVLPKVLAALAAHDDRAHSLWITGHSLGGALAMVTAAVLANIPNHPIAGVYTFGQPRVGDPTFQARYDGSVGDKTFRCVNDHDLVPHVVPRELTRREIVLARPSIGNFRERVAALVLGDTAPERYEHAGQLRLLLPQGRVSMQLADEAARAPALLVGVRTARSLIWELPQWLLEAPKELKDHAPINPFTHDGYIERIEAFLSGNGK